MKKNYLIDMAFSVETEAEEDQLMSKDFLRVLIDSAMTRLVSISREGNTEAFGVCDMYEIDPLDGVGDLAE